MRLIDSVKASCATHRRRIINRIPVVQRERLICNRRLLLEGWPTSTDGSNCRVNALHKLLITQLINRDHNARKCRQTELNLVKRLLIVRKQIHGRPQIVNHTRRGRLKAMRALGCTAIRVGDHEATLVLLNNLDYIILVLITAAGNVDRDRRKGRHCSLVGCTDLQ